MDSSIDKFLWVSSLGIPAGKPLSVSLLQGNVPQAMKFDPETAALARHQYLQMIENAPADLILLPETAWTTRWDNTESTLTLRQVGSA